MAAHAAAQLTFYEGDAYQGRSFTTDGALENLNRFGFNDRASSVVVKGDRTTRWEVCEDRRFRGRCVVLRPAAYPTLAAMGLNNRILSMRELPRNAQVADNRYAPLPRAAPVMPVVSDGSIVFYRDEGFQGRSFKAEAPTADFRASGFNDSASSAVVSGGRWEVCENTGFGGRCVVLQPGEYPNLGVIGLSDRISSTRAVARPPTAPPARTGQIDFYEGEGFQGRSFTTQEPVDDLRQKGYNDRASSVVVSGERWEVCVDTDYRGRCVVLRPGQYPSLQEMGLTNSISSVRELSRNAQVADNRYAPLPPAAPAAADGSVVFYRDEGFRGRSFTANAPMADFRVGGFNDRASSAVVSGGRWEVCENTGFGGRCVVLQPGEYSNLGMMGLSDRISSTRAVARNPRPEAPPSARTDQVDFYEGEGFQGRVFTTLEPVDDLRRKGYNDSASSVVVTGDRWEVCDEVGYRGHCVVLRQGQYPSLQAMGLNNRISSVRSVVGTGRVDEGRYAPAPLVSRNYGRRYNEQTYQAEITSVRAVVDDAGRRCWMEREQVTQERSGANVPGALLGAVIGGILGHQVGGGSGRDVATGVGVVAGAAIGANTGRKDQTVAGTQDVQRCTESTRPARPTYWDVTYRFRDQDFRVQMTTQPGSTITVNDQGEPRA